MKSETRSYSYIDFAGAEVAEIGHGFTPAVVTAAFTCDVAIGARVPFGPAYVVMANWTVPAGAGTVAVHESEPPAMATQECVAAVRFIVYGACFETGGAPFTWSSETTSDCGVVTPAVGGSTTTVNDAVRATAARAADCALTPGSPVELPPWQPVSKRTKNSARTVGRRR
jgi:hypothetical protein